MARTALLALAVVSFTALLSDRSSAADLTSTTLRPLADAAVSTKSPGRSTGRAHTLRVGPGKRDRAYLRFPGPPVGVTLQSATLRLDVRSARSARVDVYVLPAGSWTERGLRLRKAPRGGKLVARSRPVHRGKVDVRLKSTRLVQNTQPIVLAVAARRGTLTLASREVRSRAPRLTVRFPDDVAPTIAAAGDIACPPGKPADAYHCGQQSTSNLLIGQGYARVLALGDNQYETGALSDFRASYEPSWGRVRSITSPIVGNHEYSYAYPPPAGSTADGYFDYFNGVGKADGPAGHRGDGWYSYDVGTWHVIALNSMCTVIRRGNAADGCAPGSPQERWLKADLAANPSACTLVYWHHPRWTSGNGHPQEALTTTLWQDVAAAHVDLALAGHSHGYERFAPMDGAGNAVDSGVQEIVVGTGGEDFFAVPGEANTVARIQNVFGVLRLTLRKGGYDWQFVPIAGQTASDSGSRSCH